MAQQASSALGPELIRALVWARKLGLTDQDRHDLAAYLVGHEGSWESMSEEHAQRIADALRAFPAVQWLYADRRVIAGDGGALPRPALAAAS